MPRIRQIIRMFTAQNMHAASIASVPNFGRACAANEYLTGSVTIEVDAIESLGFRVNDCRDEQRSYHFAFNRPLYALYSASPISVPIVGMCCVASVCFLQFAIDTNSLARYIRVHRRAQ